MVALARKTLVYEWRRFLPAMLAVAFSGLLLLMQFALVLGIFGSASVYIRKSAGDLWVGYPGTQTIDLGRPIPSDTEMKLLMDPAAERVEPFQWLSGDWRGPKDRGGISVLISGINPHSDGLMFADVMTPESRQRLLEPDSVIVDITDLPKLNLGVGGRATINGHRVRIVGVASGLRALGGINVVTSLTTARHLNSDAQEPDWVAYYLVKLRDPAAAEMVKSRLMPRDTGTPRQYAVWTGGEFARRTVFYWMFETGAGLGVVFLAVIVFLAGVVITSQTLMAAVAGTLREYATLQALGVSFHALRKVVLEQAAWIGACGLSISVVVGGLVLLLAHRLDVPMQLGPVTAAACGALLMSIAMFSGVMAMRTLRRADPSILLR
ncbi:MAG: ABC transporter permease [Gammaproteobacteria bacterium]|nr:ABC transporter permease [Gammaproteobacteria bacterium]